MRAPSSLHLKLESDRYGSDSDSDSDGDERGFVAARRVDANARSGAIGSLAAYGGFSQGGVADDGLRPSASAAAAAHDDDASDWRRRFDHLAPSEERGAVASDAEIDEFQRQLRVALEAERRWRASAEEATERCKRAERQRDGLRDELGTAIGKRDEWRRIAAERETELARAMTSSRDNRRAFAAESELLRRRAVEAERCAADAERQCTAALDALEERVRADRQDAAEERELREEREQQQRRDDLDRSDAYNARGGSEPLRRDGGGDVHADADADADAHELRSAGEGASSFDHASGNAERRHYAFNADEFDDYADERRNDGGGYDDGYDDDYIGIGGAEGGGDYDDGDEYDEDDEYEADDYEAVARLGASPWAVRRQPLRTAASAAAGGGSGGGENEEEEEEEEEDEDGESALTALPPRIPFQRSSRHQLEGRRRLSGEREARAEEEDDDEEEEDDLDEQHIIAEAERLLIDVRRGMSTLQADLGRGLHQ